MRQPATWWRQARRGANAAVRVPKKAVAFRRDSGGSIDRLARFTLTGCIPVRIVLPGSKWRWARLALEASCRSTQASTRKTQSETTTGSHDLSAGGASRNEVREQSMVTKDDLPARPRRRTKALLSRFNRNGGRQV